MVQDVSGSATSFFEGVGKKRQAVIGTVVVDAFCERIHFWSQRNGVNFDRAEWVVKDIAEHSGLLGLFPYPFNTFFMGGRRFLRKSRDSQSRRMSHVNRAISQASGKKCVRWSCCGHCGYRRQGFFYAIMYGVIVTE